MQITVVGRIADNTMINQREVLRGARGAVRSASLAVERAVKIAMPVEWGRARASWGHWTPEHLRPGAEGASSSDALWEESSDGLSITQGSNVEYVIYLNDGHSQQAPAGFIDAAAERGQRELDRAIDELFRGL